MKFVKLKDSFNNIFWREIRDEEGFQNGENVSCYNEVGGNCPISWFEVLGTTEKECWDDLDWSGTYIDPTNKEWKNEGWIDRDGNLYPCRYMEHDVLAELWFKANVWELENAGWIRITNGVPGYSLKKKHSQAQYNKCKDLGIWLDENNVLWQ